MERTWKIFPNDSGSLTWKNILEWGKLHFTNACFLNSNNYRQDPYTRFNMAIAIGVADEIYGTGRDDFHHLQAFSEKHNDWLFGFFSYDLKNQLENLQSNNHDGVDMPLLHFFRPVILVFIYDNLVKIGCINGFGMYSGPDQVHDNLMRFVPERPEISRPITLKQRVSERDYLHQVANIKQNIQLGYIYEMNFCMEFYSEGSQIFPLHAYENLNRISPTPFSCYYQVGNKFLMSASPERFMAKRGMKLISQPIKGTIKRGGNLEEDEILKQTLLNDPKERSENVMIVDLVRNDLSRTACKGTVQVEELFGIYTFSHVHQMISTIVSQLRPEIQFTEAIKNSFPMGSMTGAPKVQALKLIENYETTRRGLYSGAVGYISPEKDFDFNVVIRSLIYNHDNRYLSCMAGSAITIGSVPEDEYKECLLKARAMQAAVSGEII
ncbi:MAG TPA: anthranilate synthase component I family protein [Bacteroidales bacterium]|nr:anthranilate synthase component I family protein [Bacteroidales bacterium]